MESSQSIKFDSFPAEIVKRISSFSPCESVLALMRVNRKLYQTCNDMTVFKAVVKNRNGHEFAEPWDCDYMSGNTSPSDWARLALADSKAQNWTAIQNQRIASLKQESLVGGVTSDLPILSTSSYTSRWKLPSVSRDRMTDPRSSDNIGGVDIAGWAPQLVALHHPFIAEGDMIGLLSGFRDVLPTLSEDPNGHAAIAFCIAATILHYGAAALKDGTPSYRLVGQQFRQFMLDIRGYPEVDTPGSKVPFLACALISNSPAVLRGVPLPSPYNIPFQSLIYHPFPFSETKFSSRSHLDVMTSSDFLTNGEWVGYYSYSLNLAVARFDPPMWGIRFSAEPNLGRLELSASGIDHIGTFTLTGSIAPNGRIRMLKVYTNYGHHLNGNAGLMPFNIVSWHWSAHMTPFGIVGTWGGGVEPQSQQGHLWLWKREWC